MLENGHLVLLGFNSGEFNLLHQLILAAGEDSVCILVVDDVDREVMEQSIRENLELPKNVRVVCRTADITDPASLDKCSLETSKSVIVNPTDDIRTLKIILAATSLLEEKGAPQVSISAILSNDAFLFPETLAKDNNISTFHTKTIIAKMIAHSCTQTGLSKTFRDVFDFDGCEFYLITIPDTGGITFKELTIRLDNAVPVGIYRAGKTIVNPPADFLVNETDRVIVFAQEDDSGLLKPHSSYTIGENISTSVNPDESTDILIFGCNEILPIVLDELPENVTGVCLVGHDMSEEQKKKIKQITEKRDISLIYSDIDPRSETAVRDLACNASHIVVLNDHKKDPEEADMEAVFLYLSLRDIRKKSDPGFNVTVELQKETTHKLVGRGDHTDFIVSSSMSSLMLAQLSESPELIEMFREILSNTGNELYLKNAGQIQVLGTHTVAQLRWILINRGYVMLGYLDADKRSWYNLPLDKTVTLTQEDNLIVLGRN